MFIKGLRVATANRDCIKLEKVLITAVSGPIGVTVHCTKSCDARSGNVGNELLQRAIRGLQLGFRNGSGSHRAVHGEFQNTGTFIKLMGVQNR